MIFNIYIVFSILNVCLGISLIKKDGKESLFEKENNNGSIVISNATSNIANLIRRKRYLGLSRRFKLNRRYQECIAYGDAQGHCKHIDFCPMNVLKTAKNVLNYLCVIERAHVGVCCPDDIALSGYGGSQLIQDLPGGGYDYADNDTVTGCGIPAEGRSAKGDPPSQGVSSIQEWPWIAALFKPADRSQNQFCGGAIITDRHIMTAAHCTHGLKANEIRVRLGEYNFQNPNETRSQDYEVAAITEHESFVVATYENDIAIVTLAKPTSFNSYVWPVCLPPVEGDYQDKIAVVAGWGQTFYGGPTSPVLLQVPVPVWAHARCVEAFLESINDNNLCAAAYEGGKDSCLGDSGGPLNYQLENGRWVTIGIVSWGIGCAEKGHPGIYTKVSNFLPWIIKNTIAET